MIGTRPSHSVARGSRERTIMNAPGSDDERIAMLGGTAAKLLGIKE